jgi:phosphoglucosamine mutase
MVNARGEKVDGDQILYVLSSARTRQSRLLGGVVGTLMSNLGLEQACAQQGIPFKRAQVGDRYVLSVLQEQGWVLGGESSGHIICLDKSTTGDGIIAALEVLAAMAESGRSLHELADGMQVYPQTLVNVRVERSFDFQSSRQVQNAVREAERELAENGRVLLRASGTEPLVRVMVEGRDAGQVSRLSEAIADSVRKAARAAA